VVWDPTVGILMQHRVAWSHFGGTWGVPGGARKAEETAEAAALREANEEANVPADSLSILHTSVFDLGFWSYTTVVAQALEPFDAVVGDHESHELRWVQVDEVENLPLHPGFAAAWPELKTWLR
jgi:8-oxo-dGTP pyrophosphatase MutT (NUDIX family)